MTNHTDKLSQGHFDSDGNLLALIDRRSDQFIVAVWTQQNLHQPLLGISLQRTWQK